MREGVTATTGRRYVGVKRGDEFEPRRRRR